MKKSRFVILSALVFVFCYFALSFVLYRFVLLRLQEGLLFQKKQDILESVSFLPSSVADSILARSGGPDSLNAVYSNVLQTRFKIRRVIVLDNQCRILSCIPSETSTGINQSPDAIRLLKNGQAGFYFIPYEKPFSLHFLQPFYQGSHVTGGLEVVFDVQETSQIVSDLAFPLFGIMASVFLLAYGLFLFRSLRLQTVLLEIRRAFHLIENGHFGFEPREDWKGEIASVFNDMKRALEHLKEREDRRNALFEKAKHIAASPRFNDLFERVADSFKTEAGIEQLIILLIKDDSLIVSHTTGYDESLILKNEIYRIQEDVFTELLDYGKPLVLEDFLEIRQNARYRAILKTSGHTVLFPITLGNEIFGIVHASRSKEKGPYKAVELDTGSVLSGGVAIGLSRLSETADGRLQSRERTKPELRTLQALPSVEVQSIGFAGSSWAECFELVGDKREDAQILCVYGLDEYFHQTVRERVAGMLEIIRKFRSTLGNLSFFALSMLLKMPVSGERERLAKQFIDNPFTPEGLCALFKDVLSSKEHNAYVEIVKIDLRKKSFQSALQDLKLYCVPDKGPVEIAGIKGPLRSGDILVAAPDHLLSVTDFEAFRSETSQDRLSAFLQNRFESLKTRTKSGVRLCPMVLIFRPQ